MANNLQDSVTIIIPAFKEERNIEAAISNAVAVVESFNIDYEIIVVDDGSPDRTGEYAHLKAAANPKVRVLSNATNQGFGYSFARGVKAATKDYVTVFPGDNDMAAVSLKDLIAARGHSTLVISYMIKNQRRSLLRRILSKVYIFGMNMIFGLQLRYYNGAFICKRELLQSLPIKSMGLAALAECIIRLLKAGKPYKAIYFEHSGRKHEKSKALTLKSFMAVIRTVLVLMRDIYWPSKNPKS